MSKYPLLFVNSIFRDLKCKRRVVEFTCNSQFNNFREIDKYNFLEINKYKIVVQFDVFGYNNMLKI